MDSQSGNAKATGELEAKLVNYTKSLSDLDTALSELQETTDLPEAELHRDAVFCMQLGITFYQEANRAVQGGAYFASAAIGASALEAVLLAKALIESKAIQSLAEYKRYAGKKGGSFRDVARSLDLGKLLELARLRSWVPSGGIPKILR